MFFRTKRDYCEDLVFHEILTVYELHVYELLKFLLQSLTKSHEKDFPNELFS